MSVVYFPIRMIIGLEDIAYIFFYKVWHQRDKDVKKYKLKKLHLHVLLHMFTYIYSYNSLQFSDYRLYFG